MCVCVAVREISLTCSGDNHFTRQEVMEISPTESWTTVKPGKSSRPFPLYPKHKKKV